MNSKRTTTSLICCLLLFFSSIDAFSCSLSISPLKGFDRSEYIFIGEILEVIGPFESEKFVDPAWGLRVKVVTPIFIPKVSQGYFEVFDFDLGADCSTMGMSKDRVSKSYSISSRIKVIAKEAKLLPNRLNDGKIRLEILPGSLGSISRNSYEDGKEMSSVDSLFDYQAYDSVPPKSWIEDVRRAYYFLPRFELRKDLLRLEKTSAQYEKIKILERLLYYPNCCDLDYHQIIKTYIYTPSIRKTLIRRREKAEKQR
jgi:hypothetical protein